MTSNVMLIVYIAIFVLQIVLLVLSVRKKKKEFWIALFLSEIVPMIVAFVLMLYFDSLPGHGFMPGLSYFGEVIYSLGAVILYAVTLLVSLCFLLIFKLIKQLTNKPEFDEGYAQSVNTLDTQSTITKAYKASRQITITFAILGPTVMIGSAVIMTLCEGDWWFNLFAVYLAAIAMITGTLYLSLLTLMWEITRHIGNKVKADFCDMPIAKWLHRLLAGMSVAGILIFIPFFLIFLDILNGGFAIFHFLCAAIIAALYLALGINAMINRVKARSST